MRRSAARSLLILGLLLALASLPIPIPAGGGALLGRLGRRILAGSGR
jgi:hypothetical protein